MTFDFYGQYQNASTVELLKIVGEPDSHQMEAVDAANRVLRERSISEEEQLQADTHFRKITEKKQAKLLRRQVLQEKTESLLEPLLEHSEEFSPAKWVYYIVIAIGLQLLVMLATSFRYVLLVLQQFFRCMSQRTDSFFECFGNYFDVFSLLFLIAALLPILYIYLLVKRKRWGWILLFADAILSLTSLAISGFLSYYHPSLGLGLFDIRTVVFLLIKIGLVYFLWKKEMTDYFFITQDIKLYSLLAGIGLGIVLRIFT